MDIDDILVSIDREHFSSPASTALDHQQLTRCWVAERAVSELLPWPGPLMERMMERVRKRIEIIEDLSASSSSSSSSLSSKNNNNNNNNPSLNLKLSILQTDLSRTQYLIRSLLRQRLAKLTHHSMHYLLIISSPPNTSSTASQPEDTIPDPRANLDPTPLSLEEATFLHAHQTLLAAHYGVSFLSSFPPQLRRLDDNAGGTAMIQGPDSKEVVFVRCLVDEVTLIIPSDDTLSVEELGTTMRIGEVWVVRWEGIKRAWERGEVELL